MALEARTIRGGQHPPLDGNEDVDGASLSFATHTFSFENFARQIRDKMDLAVDIAAVKRQEIERVGLPWHPIDGKIPNHFDGTVFSLMRMKIGRTKFDIEVGNLASDPPVDDFIPRLVGAGHITLRGVFAFRDAAAQSSAHDADRTCDRHQNGSMPHGQPGERCNQ